MKMLWFLVAAVVLVSGCVSEVPKDMCSGVTCPDTCSGNERLFNGSCSLGSCGYMRRVCTNDCSDGVCLNSSYLQPQVNQTVTQVCGDGVCGSGEACQRDCAKKNQPPEASLSASPASGAAPLKVTFYAVCSDPDGNATCTLDFGDSSAAPINASVVTTLQHTYNASNQTTFTAILTAADNNGTTTVRLFPVYVSV